MGYLVLHASEVQLTGFKQITGRLLHEYAKATPERVSSTFAGLHRVAFVYLMWHWSMLLLKQSA